MKKKVVIIGVCAIAVIIVIAAVALALVQNQSPSYSVLLERGDRYLSAGDYKQAVVVYKRAIAEKPMQPDGYIGLARAYVQLDQKDLAVVTLGNGYQMTHSLTIRLRLEELDPEYFERMEQGKPLKSVSENLALDDKESQSQEQDISVNTDLMSFMSTASYEDYQKKYGNLSGSLEGGAYVLRISGLDVAVRFFNTDTAYVLDSSGMPFRECIPNEIIIEGLAPLFGNVSQISLRQLQRIRQISNLRQNGEKITFTLCGCEISVPCDDDGTIGGDAVVTLVPTGENQGNGEFRVSGRVVDAATGSAVSGVKIRFCPNGSSSDAVEVTTSAGGFYEIYLSQAGMYDVKIRKDGYIEEDTQVYLAGGSTEEYRDFTISPVLQTGEIRLVLTWGEYPRDLDSYLSGSTDSGEGVNVSYHSKSARANGNTLAELDVDDMNGYGPETITLYALNGTYEYYVKDYLETDGMGNSGAQVKIYKGDSLVRTINIGGDVGNTWYVCTIDHGNII